ncbi:transmembrane channel-like protein 7 [Culicoides brevitarsis]|uniref:transmembrane channel-like protein 7 n=1 Tax=Culicoides brevitarsis TaxID=469753 RepID=UPI00307BA8A8
MENDEKSANQAKTEPSPEKSAFQSGDSFIINPLDDHEIGYLDSEGEEMMNRQSSTANTAEDLSTMSAGNSAQRRWSLNFSRNKKFLYQKTVSFKPARRLRRSFDNPLGSQKYENIETITEDFEQHEELMEDSQLAEQLRVQTIRSLPQTLSVKREIRANLSKTIGRRSSANNSGDFWKHCKNYGKLLSKQLQRRIEHTGNRFELWYDSLKTVEGHFGSSVGAYFRFLRFLYITNVILAVSMIAFVAFPQWLFNNTENPMIWRPKNVTKNESQILLTPELNNWAKYEVVIPENLTVETLESKVDEKKLTKIHEPIYFSDIFTALHGLKSSIMFYGSYTNETFALKVSNYYSMPHAYLITTSVLYTLVFTIVSINVARSYRRSFIESSGAIHKLFSHRILCAWDFNLCFIRGAKMKRDAIVQDFRDLLAEVNAKAEAPETNLRRFYGLLAQLMAHVLVVLLMSGVAIGVWMLLLSRNAGRIDDRLFSVFYLPIAVNIIVSFFQNVFGWIASMEEYHSPGTVLHIHLLRNFLLLASIVGPLTLYWIEESRNIHCWETAFGQDIYRIIVVDLLFSCLGVPFYYALRYVLHRQFPHNFSLPPFNISHACLKLVFSQTLTWLGVLYSPLLPLVLVIKMAIIFYIKKYTLIKFCKPPQKLWRSSQTRTLFMVLTFLSLFSAIVINCYIVTQVSVSKNCGPFRGSEEMVEVLIKDIDVLKDDNMFWSIIASLTKPAVVAGILLTMTVIVYYLRAKSRAHTEMVKLLKEMLYLEARDKAFLISSIKQLTNNSGFLLEDADFVLRGKPYMRHSRNNSCTTWVFTTSPSHSRNPSGNNPHITTTTVVNHKVNSNHASNGNNNNNNNNQIIQEISDPKNV